MFWLDDIKNEIQRAKVLDLYFKALLHHRRNTCIQPIESWCISNLKKSFKDVICASPDTLVKLRDSLDQLQNSNITLNKKEANYIINTLYGTIDNDGYGKSAKQVLIEATNITVCPYCNRNFIYNISNPINKKVKSTCELDHFFPKKKYPLLAVSFYNLIPSCHFCNHMKGTKELQAFYPYLITSAETSQIRFTYHPLAVDYLSNKDSLKVDINTLPKIICSNKQWNGWNSNNIRHDISILKLNQLYEKHNDVVQKLLLKYQLYDDDYFEAIYQGFSQYFNSVSEVKELMMDTPADLHEARDTPLGKLKLDIWEEINQK